MPRKKKEVVGEESSNLMLWFGVFIVIVILIWYGSSRIGWWQERMMGEGKVWEDSEMEVGEYYAVYMTTGDIYFGQMDKWQKNTLKNVHLLRLTEDENNPVVVENFTSSIWGPEGDLILNDDNIVWRAKISDTSQLTNILKNQI